jgi:hypothetical protein
MNVVNVNCTLGADVFRLSVIRGRPGRYMSVASGAIADSNARTHNMGMEIVRCTKEL